MAQLAAIGAAIGTSLIVVRQRLTLTERKRTDHSLRFISNIVNRYLEREHRRSLSDQTAMGAHQKVFCCCVARMEVSLPVISGLARNPSQLLFAVKVNFC